MNASATVERRCQCGVLMDVVRGAVRCIHCDAVHEHPTTNCSNCKKLGAARGVGPRTT